MSSESANFSATQSFELLAAALAGRPLRVSLCDAGDLTWTDGNTVFVDSSLADREQLMAVIVQASMISAGSFTPDILRKIKRRPALASRYLAIEAVRALATNEYLLPAFMHKLLNNDAATRHVSPAASLERALSKAEIAVPAKIFGTIRADRLLRANAGQKRDVEQAQIHKPQQQRNALTELEDQEIDSNENSGVAVDMFSVPGAAGLFGRWLQKMLRAVRQGNASGTPGIDAPTHRTSKVPPRGASSVLSTAAMDVADDVIKQGSGIKYPEWNVHQRSYRSNWCSVQEIGPQVRDTAQIPAPDAGRLQRPLARLGLGLDHCHRQSQGDDIDIDAAIEARIEVMAGSAPDENIYVNSLRRRRDLSVLILLDISGSAMEPGAFGQTVHEQQRAVAAALLAALHNLGDRVALYAYNSQGRASVQLIPVKRFGDHFNSITMQRLYSLVPGAYSRLGAAIRHGAAVLETQGGTSRRLLVVLSDGLAYDHGYERDYGAADARRALAEARRRGTGALCLTVGASTDAESLQRVFGSAAHATISKPSQVGDVVAALFHSALRSAEVKRRVS